MSLLKKCISAGLVAAVAGLNFLPATAETYFYEPAAVNAEAPPVQKTIIHANNVINLTFVNEFNVNASEIGMPVKFRLDQQFTDADGDVLPAGTMFYGKVDSLTKSRFGFRKASAQISINSMVLPGGTAYQIDARPQQDKLTSTAAANVAKGVATSAACVTVGIFGAALIAVETLSVGGIIFAPYTGAAMGVAFAATSKGVNYKVPAGTKISFVFDRPVDAFSY